jgi:hypothetical protein
MYSYFKQIISFFFFLRKMENRRAEHVLWGREKRGKGVGGLMWCKYCVHMYVNGKMRPVETIPGLGEEG